MAQNKWWKEQQDKKALEEELNPSDQSKFTPLEPESNSTKTAFAPTPTPPHTPAPNPPSPNPNPTQHVTAVPGPVSTVDPARAERERFLTELLDTTSKTVANISKRLNQTHQEDQETLQRIAGELEGLRRGNLLS